MVDRTPPDGAPCLHLVAWRRRALGRPTGVLPGTHAEVTRLSMENRRLRRTVARLRFDRRVLLEALLRDIR